MNTKDIVEMNLFKVVVGAEPIDVIDKPVKLTLYIGFRTQSGEPALETAISLAMLIAKEAIPGAEQSYELRIAAISELGDLHVWEMK